MTLLLNALAVLTFLGTTVLALARMLFALALLPFNVVAVLLGALFVSVPVALNAMQDKTRTLIAFVVLASVLVLGFFMLHETSAFLTFYDFAATCVVGRVWQFVSKVLLVNLTHLWCIVAEAYNIMLAYFISRGQELIVSVQDIVVCVVDIGNPLYFFGLPSAFWTWISSLFYIVSTSPLVSRNEFFGGGPGTLTYYAEFPAPAPPGGGVTDAYEFPSDFGAFGPAPTVDANDEFVGPDRMGRSRYIARTFFHDFFEIVRRTGALVTQVASDLQRPAGRFAVNLIVRVDVSTSYWGQVGDLLSKATCFVIGTWAYEVDAASSLGDRQRGYSQTRFEVESIIGQGFRIVACAQRWLALLFNDLTTFNRAIPAASGTCETIPDPISNLFIGFPIVDIILASFDAQAYGTDNLNINRANYEYCRLRALTFYFEDYVAEVSDESVSDLLTHSGACEQGVMAGSFVSSPQLFVPTTFRRFANGFKCGTTSQCLDAGLAPTEADEFAEKACDIWYGDTTLAQSNRVDYLHEAVLCIYDTIMLFTDPYREASATATARRRETYISLDLAECFIDKFTHGAVAAISEAAVGGESLSCPAEISWITFWDLSLQTCLVDAIEFVYSNDNPDSPGGGGLLCYNVVGVPVLDPNDVEEEAVDNNALLCLLGALSNRVGSVFETICDFLETDFGVFGPIQEMQCEGYRKRSVRSFEELHRPRAGKLRQWATRAYLYLAGVASEVRSSSRALDTCILDEHNSTLAQCLDGAACGTSRCSGDVLDCLHGNVRNDTELARLTSPHNWLVRNAVFLGAHVADLASGCRDNIISQSNDLLGTLTTLAHDLLVRFGLVAFDFTQAYGRCMERATRASERGLFADQVQLVYLRCLYGEPDTEFDAPHAASTDTPTSNDTENSSSNSSSNSAYVMQAPLSHALSRALANVTHGSDPWHTELASHGIESERTMCGTVLNDFGFALDTGAKRLPRAKQSGNYVVHRLCTFVHAFAVRSSLHGGPSVGRFLDGWTAPSALLASTSGIDTSAASLLETWPATNNDAHRLLLDTLEADGERVRDFARRLESNTRDSAGNGDGESLLTGFASLLYRSMRSTGSLYEAGTYMADVHDELVAKAAGRTSHELDAAEFELRQRASKHVLSLAASPERAARRFKERLGAKPQPRRTEHVLEAFAHALHWTAETSDGVSMDVNLKSGLGGPLLFSVRLHSNETAAHGERWTMVPAARVKSVLLETAMHGDDDDVQLRGRALTLERQFDRMHALAHGEAVRVSSAIFSTAFRIVNRFVRAQSLPPYQASVMALDVLANSAPENLAAWTRGELGYIVGTGFVERAIYDDYMAGEEELRRRHMSLFSTQITEDDIHASFLIDGRAVKRRQRRRAAEQKTALPGSSLLQRLRRAMFGTRDGRRLRMRNRHTIARRAQFIVQHDLHAHDEHGHRLVPPTLKELHRAAKHMRESGAHADLETRRRFNVLASSDDVNAYLLSLLEWALAQLGAVVDFAALEDTLIQFGDDALMAIETFFDGLLQGGTAFFDDLACTGPGAYRKGGTEPYVLGCVPFAPERLLSQVEQFTANPSGKGFFGFFEGPGYVEWPAEMIAVPCAARDLPDSQCPNPAPPLWQPFTDGSGTVSDAFDDFADGLFDTYFCFSDMCPLPAASVTAPASYPLCPVCDLCVQQYVSAFDFGFTDGVVNLVYVSMAADAYLGLLFGGTMTETTLFVVMFLIWTLGAYVPFVNRGLAWTIVALAVFGKLAFVQSTELFLSLVPLIVLYELLPFVGWTLFALYGLELSSPGTLTTDVVPFVQSLLPAPLVLALLQFLEGNAVVSFLTGGNTAPIAALIVRLQAFETMGVTVAGTLYFFLSFVNLIVLALLLLLALGLVYGASRLVLPLAQFALSMLEQALVIVRAYRVMARGIAIRANSAAIDELSDDQAALRRRARSLGTHDDVEHRHEAEQDRRLRELEEHAKEE